MKITIIVTNFAVIDAKVSLYMKKKVLGTSLHIDGFHKTLLILRIVGGLLMIRHGWDKLMHFDEYSLSFFEFFGLPATISLALATFAEFVCSIMLLLGIFARVASTLLLVTMFVAAVMFHIIQQGHGIGEIELPLLYLMCFLITALYGAGKYSMDKIFFKI